MSKLSIAAMVAGALGIAGGVYGILSEGERSRELLQDPQVQGYLQLKQEISLPIGEVSDAKTQLELYHQRDESLRKYEKLLANPSWSGIPEKIKAATNRSKNMNACYVLGVFFPSACFFIGGFGVTYWNRQRRKEEQHQANAPFVAIESTFSNGDYSVDSIGEIVEQEMEHLHAAEQTPLATSVNSQVTPAPDTFSYRFATLELDEPKKDDQEAAPELSDRFRMLEWD